MIRSKCIDPVRLIQPDKDSPSDTISQIAALGCCSSGRDAMKLMWTDTAHRDWDGYLKAPKVIFNGPSKPRKGKSTLYLTDSYKLHCIIKCIKPHGEDLSAFPNQVEEHPSKLKGCRSKRGVVVWIRSKGSGGKAWVNPGYVCLLSERTFHKGLREVATQGCICSVGEMCSEPVWHLTTALQTALWKP